MLDLTHDEIGSIIRAIEPVWYRYARQYDEQKYPPSELKRLRDVFSTPESVSEQDITAALIWKYGHTGKRNYPSRQRALAGRIAKNWPENAISPAHDPEAAFRRWRSLLGPTSFITVCFLLHLVLPDTLPILDQHNYRSVNQHLVEVRSERRVKAKPSRFDDLLLVRDFSAVVLEGWERNVTSRKPNADDLDRYFMMHGKSLKNQGRTALPLVS